MTYALNAKKLIAIISAALFMTSCGSVDVGEENQNNKISYSELTTSSNEIVLANRDEQYEHDDNVCTDYELFFSSLDDLAGYLIENRNGSESILFESESQLNPKEELTMYTPAFLPEGYELTKIRLHGSFIAMYYDNNISNHSITFVWGYKTAGREYIKNAVKGFRLSKMDKMDGFYHSYAVDDYNVPIDQIYWEYNDNCFQTNIPREIVDDITANGYLGLNMTSYSFSEPIEWSFMEEESDSIIYYDSLEDGLNAEYPN